MDRLVAGQTATKISLELPAKRQTVFDRINRVKQRLGTVTTPQTTAKFALNREELRAAMEKEQRAKPVPQTRFGPRHVGAHPWSYKRQRGGIETLMIVVIAAGALALGAYFFGRHDGAALVRAEWDMARAAAAQAETERTEAVDAALLEADHHTAVAESAAADFDAQRKEAEREARRNRKPLAACPEPGPDRSPGDAAESVARAPAGSGVVPAGRPRSDPGIRLLWRFVGLHDGAYSDINGQPLFGAGAQFAAAPERADTASPYGLDELVDIDADNARGHSYCLRWADDTLKKLHAAGVAWVDKRKGDPK